MVPTWKIHGKFHREDGPAVIRANGTKEWYLKGKLYREDGPAVIRPDGTKEWYLNGKYHRTDGPAVIYADGTKEWYLHGKIIDEEEFNKVFNCKEEDLPLYINEPYLKEIVKDRLRKRGTLNE